MRHSELWLRTQTGYWMTTIAGKQVKLSQDRAEARKMLYDLLAHRDDQAQTIRPSFRKLADLYLCHCERTQAKTTFTNKKHYLNLFCKQIGRKAVADLRPHHVSAWVAANPHWNESTQSTVKGYLLSVVGWAVAEGLVPDHHLGTMSAGQFRRRERILTQVERQQIRQAVSHNPDLADFLSALELTGARPFSEVAKITAAMIDWATMTIPFDKHKTMKKGKKRTIYLTESLSALLKRKAERRPCGSLFVTRLGNPWSAPALCWHLRKLQKKLGIPKLITYSWRHTFITDALAKGLSADLVAELVGNSPQTIARFYSHLESRRDVMRKAAQAALADVL
jgi:integrase